jgi:hypothetical protein
MDYNLLVSFNGLKFGILPECITELMNNQITLQTKIYHIYNQLFDTNEKIPSCTENNSERCVINMIMDQKRMIKKCNDIYDAIRYSPDGGEEYQKAKIEFNETKNKEKDECKYVPPPPSKNNEEQVSKRCRVCTILFDITKNAFHCTKCDEWECPDCYAFYLMTYISRSPKEIKKMEAEALVPDLMKHLDFKIGPKMELISNGIKCRECGTKLNNEY